jgi:hypothetical protein
MVSRELAGATSRDAIEGFEAIANALDHGFDPAHRTSSKLGDFLAIAAGWLVLGAVVFYPGLQLAAIVVCAAFFAMRGFARLILGPGPSGRQAREGRALLAA